MEEAPRTNGLPVDFQAVFDASPTPLLVVSPSNWTIIAANDARLRATGTTRDQQIGRPLFDVFPDDPEDPEAGGVRNLTASLERVVATRSTDTMAVQRYSLKGVDGQFVERWWAPVNTPVLDADGDVAMIIHHVEDVTEVIQLRDAAEGRDRLARGQQMVIDRLRTSEAELQEAQDRYLALFNAIDQGFCTIEVAFDDHDVATDYRFLEISPSFARQTGIENGTGRWMREIAPDQDQFWFDTYGRVARTGEPAHFENHSTPLARWWDVFAFRLSGERRVAVLFRDITDQKQSEIALRESEEFNRRVLASSTDCIKVLDLEGRLTFMSEGGMCVMEVDDFPSIAGTFWPDFWTGEGRNDALAALATALAGGAGRFTGFATTMRGNPRWWDVAVTPILGSDGVPERLLTISRDITSMRLAERQLRNFNDNLERQVAERTADRDRMWRLSTDIMLVARLDGTISSVNPAWAATLGWDGGDLIGTNFLDLVHPEDRAQTIGEMSRLDQGLTTFRFENRYLGSDGEFRRMSWTAVPGDDLIHAVGRDITEESARADALRIAEEALRQSQKMEAMGQLTGGVAHDFNNLLTPIVGSLDLLQRKQVGGEREQRLIAGAIQSADRAKTLVQRLLAFARRQPLQPVAVDVGRLIEGMADLLASTTGPQIRVVVDVAADLPPAKADPNQLEMALLNLGVNARDAMPDGGTLRISATRDSVRSVRGGLGRGHYVRLSVADTGTGMDAATLARAVEPFFSTKGIGKGTGLGLSMAHGLAAQLGGALTIQSRENVGTNIELWLPISPTALEAESDSPSTTLLGQDRGIVLLVDDEDVVRASTADMLEDLGYDVRQVDSAEAALRLIADGLIPDLLVSDHLMPGMSGVDLADRLREVFADLPVLIVSGYAEAEGIAPHLPRLTKPFRSAELEAGLAALEAQKS